jgi:SAM-dependent methyltransferase
LEDLRRILAEFEQDPPETNATFRTSLREDFVIEQISLLLEHGEVARVLDCGCRYGRLAQAIEKSDLPLDRISYTGLDSNNACIDFINAMKWQGSFCGFRGFDVRHRDAEDVSGLEEAAFDAIVLNLLSHHIVFPSLVELLEKLNRSLSRPEGTLSIFDWEVEPIPLEHCGPWVLPLMAREVQLLLQAGGFHVRSVIHQRSVPVFRIVAAQCDSVDTHSMDSVLIDLLTKKHERLVAEFATLSATSPASHIGKINTACAIATLDGYLHNLKSNPRHRKAR